LAGSYNNLGAFTVEIGKYGPAQNAFLKSLSIRKKLADAWPMAPEYQRDLAGVYINLGASASKSGRWHQAKAAFHKALAVQKKLANSQPEAGEYLVDLGANYCNLGDVMRALGKFRLSVKLYSTAIEWLQLVLKKQPRLGSAKKILHYASWGRAMAYALLGRHADAVRATAEAGDLIKAKSLADRDLFDLAMVFSLAAAAALRGSRLTRPKSSKLGEQYAGQAVELLERITGNGFFQEPNNVKLLMDKNLDHLRERTDFKNLMTQMGNKCQN
jgi:tetratricopeptide (TPR) repeat protein